MPETPTIIAEPAGPPAETETPARSPRRAIACGVVGVVLLCLVTPYTDLVVRGSWIAHNCLPIGALFLFIFLATGVNRLLGRFGPRAALSRAELLLVYAMMLVASGIPSEGLAQMVIPLIVAPAHYAETQSDWSTVLLPLIPRWLRISDPEAVRLYFTGCHGGQHVPWGVWLVPLGAWALHAVLLYSAFLFLVLLLQRPWVEHERLTFPLVQMPLEIAGREGEGGRGFFRNGWMWAGLLLALGAHSLNSIHRLVPGVPAAMEMSVPIGTSFTQSPWHVLRGMRIFIHFSAIGLTYLLAGNVSLSLWVFWVVAKAQMVLLTFMGFEGAETQANVTLTPLWFVSMQMWGALLAYGLYLVYDGYRTAARDWQMNAARGKERGIPPAAALAGFGVSVLLLTGWNVAAGGTFTLQLAALVAWILTMLSLTRLVCAGGLMLIDTNWLPMDILYRGLGQSFVRPRDLAALTQYNTVFTWWPQLNMMPFLFTGVRATYGEWRGSRPVVWAMAIAIVVAIPVSFAATLWLVYHNGATKLGEWRLGGIARDDLRALVGYLQQPTDLQPHALATMGLGAAVMLGLIWLQRSVGWWPLSPLGYLVGGSFTVMDRLWFCTFVGWAANAVVRRYGGLRGYVRFRPFFLGLILGEFGAAALWLAIDAALGVTDHSVFP